MPLPNEKELLLQMSEGDEEAFRTLYNLYRGRIYTVGYNLLNSNELAEELVQDVFLRIWIKRTDLVKVDYFTPYLYTMARNHAYSALRRVASRFLSVGEAEDAIPDNTTDETILGKDYRAILQQAVRRLPPQQAMVYQLSKEQHLKREEIAARMNISPETVKTYLNHAMRSVRAYCSVHMEIDLIILCIIFSL